MKTVEILKCFYEIYNQDKMETFCDVTADMPKVLNDELLHKIASIHAAWNDKDDDDNAIYKDNTLACIKSADTSDVSLIKNGKMLDLLWMMFYISDDVKYTNVIKAIANDQNFDQMIRAAARWSYNSNMEHADDIGIAELPSL